MLRSLSTLLLLALPTAQGDVNPAPILWDKPIDGTVTDIYYDKSGAVWAFTEAPCGIVRIGTAFETDPTVYYTCPDPNDIRITSFAPIPRETNRDQVEGFILMIQQGNAPGTTPSGAQLTGRMARITTSRGSIDIWSVNFNPDAISFAPSAKPVVRTSCCTNPQVSDNVYINLYGISPAGPVIAAYTVNSGALVFSNNHNDAYSGKLFGSMYGGTIGAFNKLYAGIDDLNPENGATINPTLLTLDAESGNITAAIMEDTCLSNDEGKCEPGIPAAPFVDDNGNIYFSDRANGNFALDSDLNVISTTNQFFEFSLYFDTWLFGISHSSAEDIVFPTAFNAFDNMSPRWRSFDYTLPVVIDDLLYKDSVVYYLGTDTWYGFNADDGVLITTYSHPEDFSLNVAWAIGPDTAGASDGNVLYVATITAGGQGSSVRAYDTTANASPPPTPAPVDAPTTPNPTVTPGNPTASPTMSPTDAPTDSAAFQTNAAFATVFVAALVAALPFGM